MKTPALAEIIGWSGAAAILAAYATVSFGWLSSVSLGYQFLNLFGGLGVAFVSLRKKNYQPVFVNIIWSIVAVWSLFHLIFN